MYVYNRYGPNAISFPFSKSAGANEIVPKRAKNQRKSQERRYDDGTVADHRVKHRIAPELEPTVCRCEEMRRLLYVHGRREGASTQNLRGISQPHNSRLVGYDG
jgi:hypothetical protein